MENNLNHSGIEAYCDRFCEKLVSRHFEANRVITGKEILEFQEIRQINLFVMKYLLSEWTKEASKIKSPYFDYEVPEVKNALKDFMNVLSRHIAIEREHFFPLLKKATYDTLLLIFSPYDYYMHLIHQKRKMSLKELKRLAKYVKINYNLLDELISKVEAQGPEKIPEEEASKLLNEVFQNIQESPADVEEYIAKFSETEPLTESMIYGDITEIPDHSQPAGPWIEEEDVEEDVEEQEESAPSSSNESRQTLHEKHSADQKPTLADIHRRQKIESIRKHMGINQRFMFINVLFDGNEEHFNSTIDYLESCSNRDAAFMYLSSEYPNWDQNSEEVIEFIELVEKRF